MTDEQHDHDHGPLTKEAETAIVRKMAEHHGGRLSKHRLGDDLATKTPFAMRVAKRRKRSKASKKGRRAARG